MFDEAKKLNELKNQKITMIYFSEFGFPIAVNVKIKNVKVESYAQYDKAIYVIYRPKHKRTDYRKVILPDQKVLVYNEWIDLPQHILYFEDDFSRTSKYTSFDPQYFEDIEKELGKPLLKIN